MFHLIVLEQFVEGLLPGTEWVHCQCPAGLDPVVTLAEEPPAERALRIHIGPVGLPQPVAGSQSVPRPAQRRRL